jgi:hypothetical protein
LRRTTGHRTLGQVSRARRLSTPLNRSSVAAFAKDRITGSIITDPVYPVHLQSATRSFFSDGQDNASWLNASQLLQSLERAILVVYVMATQHPEVLDDIAVNTGGEVFPGAADRRLPAVFVRVLDQFRSGYVLSYSPEGVKRLDGWHELSVRLAADGHAGRNARPAPAGHYVSLP